MYVYVSNNNDISLITMFQLYKGIVILFVMMRATEMLS